jgi:hypothetical protein
MGDFLLYGIIATLVSLLVPVLVKNRNFYFFSLAVILAGVALAVWGYKGSKISLENYIPKEVWIDGSVFRETDESIKIFAERQEYVFPKQNLSISDVEIVKREGSKLAGAATIWTRADDTIVTGIASIHLSIDAQAVLESERSLFKRFRNVGIGISVFGLLLFTFHYFTTPRNFASARLTQKY